MNDYERLAQLHMTVDDGKAEFFHGEMYVNRNELI